MLSNCGRFYTFAEFQAQYQVNTNFLVYQNIIRSIKNYLRQFNFNIELLKEQNTMFPMISKIILANEKGCRTIYETIKMRKTLPNSWNKWEIDLNTNNINWKAIYGLPFRITKDPTLQWFQYRINHKLLGTYNLLHKMGIRNNNLCSFCSLHPETLVHLLWDCEIV